MKSSIWVLLLFALSQPVMADSRHYYGHRPSFSFYYGPSVMWGRPWGPPGYYYPPAYVYYPPVITVREEPPVYIEQREVLPPPVVAPQAQQPLEPGYWYYCAEQAGYYPAVKQCAGPWQKVAPVAAPVR